ncbi:MAG TPA: hypothetical protein VEI94_01020 [Candidatus Bathyarchaeia archaeon]|nr:hypothetical protein [Candidatus Bathyarchaeia archaeon]
MRFGVVSGKGTSRVAAGLALLLAVLAACTSGGAEVVAPATDWKPAAYAQESTIQLRTTAAGEGEHWFPVWLVIVGGDVYVRLGSRAAGRIKANTTNPYIAVRIAGKEFDHVKFDEAPAEAERVAQAMADKYWSDVIVHRLSHPLTLRLRPE